MNFVIRNLWWILLIIFFIFMLYLISNQNNAQNVPTSKGAIVSESTEQITETNIKTKIEKVEETSEEKNSSENKAEVEEASETKGEPETSVTDDSVVLAQEPSPKQWTFLKGIKDFFTIKKTSSPKGESTETENSKVVDTEENSEQVTKDTEIKDSEIENSEIESKEENTDTENTWTKEEVSTKGTLKIMTFSDSVWEDDMKDTTPNESIISLGNKDESDSSNDIEWNLKKSNLKKTTTEWSTSEEKAEQKNDTEMNSKEGDTKKSQEQTVTQKNKTDQKVTEEKATEKKSEEAKKTTENSSNLPEHTVSVNALKINDAWFTKALGYVAKGDTIQQLTSTNKYGCFKWEVLTAQKSQTQGTIGWFCEYYMEGLEDTLYAYEAAASGYYNNNKKTTNIGKNHNVAVHSLKLNNAYFTQSDGYLLAGDTVKQLTETNSYGCFKAHVIASKIAQSNNKIGWVCNTYLK